MAERLTRCRPVLGTFVEVTADSEAAADAAFEAIEHVHRLMSAHEPDSDLSRINRFAHREQVQVDPWTAAVLDRALYWSQQSDGAFDVIAAGAAAIANRDLPRHSDQPEPRSHSWRDLRLQDCFVRLSAPACIDLGGIAKGFAVDRAVAAMEAAGATAGLVNAGGDIAGFGNRAWTVQVVEPATRSAVANVAVTNGAVATSSVQPNGGEAHLLRRSPELRSVTVCAPNATDADALTKIVLSGSPVAPACLATARADAFVINTAGAIRPIEPHRAAA
jgi:thiamine biosynthesis lipoprotein